MVTVSTISFFSNHQVVQASAENKLRQSQLENANAMRRQTLEILLAAMDTLVDKEEGKILPERKRVMEENLAHLRGNLGVLVESADTPEEQRIANGLAAKIDGLEHGVLKDLANLLEQNASDEEFSKLDDVLDENGTGLDEELGIFAASVQEEMTEAIEGMNDALDLAETSMIAATIIAILILGVAIYAIVRSITTALSNMTEAMGTLAKGDTTITIPSIGEESEIGRMADAVQVFKDEMVLNEQLAQKAAQEQEARSRRASKVDELTKGFDHEIASVLQTVSAASSQMEGTAGSLSTTAEETSHQASAVASAAEQASANVQTVSAAAEQLSNSIQEISHQVIRSTEIAGKAVHEAQDTHAQVQSLAEAASRIGDVVNLITDIAEQTNLLALNATIEAARAGDAGKGFAVVAAEVKNLANQTQKATEEISNQIMGVQSATQEAVQAIDGIGSVIGQINEIATAIASAIEQQGAATRDIALNVEQASAGTREVTLNIEGVNAAAAETGSASNDVLGAAQELAKQAEGLRTVVQTFLDAVKSA